MSIPHVDVHLDSAADQVLLHGAPGSYPHLTIGTELTVHLDQASTATLQAVIDRLTEAVEAREQAAEVAAQVAAEDGVRHIGVPVQRNGSVAA